MPAHDSAAAARPDEPIPDDLAEVGVYRTTEEGFDHCLVVLALGYACWLMPFETGYRLLVETSRGPRVRTELLNYESESSGWPPRIAPEVPATAGLDFATPLLWALAVLGIFRAQLLYPEWTDVGSLDAKAIFEKGEIWRVVTALFLHADAAHLTANLCSGVCFFAALLPVFGRARGWLLLGLAAIAGNLAAAALHYPEGYRSIGASTAIFAALGLLTGRAVRIAARTRHPHRWRSLFVPTAAGLTFLALYGTGGPSVDLVAHLTGFGAGFGLGFIACRPAPNPSSEAQLRTGATAPTAPSPPSPTQTA